MGYRVLVVDDEPIIIEGIKSKLKWKQFGVDLLTTAADGIDALNKITVMKPDIVITDVKMPEMDGITLISKAQKIHDSIKFIIISGYAEFEYAKQAIALGVKEYILKPVDPEELKDAVKSAIKEIEYEWALKENLTMLRGHNEKNRLEERDRQLCDLLLEYGSDEKIKAGLSQLNVNFKKGFYRVGVLKIKKPDLVELGFEEHDTDLFIYCLRNILSELSSSATGLIYFKSFKNNDEFVFVLNHGEDPGDGEIIVLKMHEIIRILNSYLKVRSSAGIGNSFDKLSDITKSYNQAKYALNERIIGGYQKVYNFNNDSGKAKRQYKDEAERKGIFIKYLEEGNKEETVKYIEKLFDKDAVRDKDWGYSQIRDTVLDIYVCLKDFFHKNDHKNDIIRDKKLEYLDAVFNVDSIKELVELLIEHITKALDSVAQNKKHTGEQIVNEVINLINNEYTNKISLNAVSEKYYINPNYFCRIFKDYTGKNFKEYLTEVRIKKACELIRSTNLKFSQISDLTGFEDPKYFSKVFKKEVGQTPADYLRSQRN